MGMALMAITKSRLYRCDYDTWDQYNNGKWGFPRQQAGYLMRGYEAHSLLVLAAETETTGFHFEHLPTSERSVMTIVWTAEPITLPG